MNALSTRDIKMALLCLSLSVPAFAAGQGLLWLIDACTRLMHGGSLNPSRPDWGVWAVLVPALGGLGVGLIARFGHKAIRGHGIPEAMEQVLTNHSRIPARVAWLKPLSAALSIGSGGPFGAEGPIIATGGALGSLFGQKLKLSSRECKVLLAAGAAAGMSAIFGTPLAALLLALELLLFEFHPGSVLAVGSAAAAAAAFRSAFVTHESCFPMPLLNECSGYAFAAYAALGLPLGIAAAGVSRAIYTVEEGFERLNLHWMWWPLLGGLAVGVVGLIEPLSLGVGYGNITAALDGSLAGKALLFLVTFKFLSWSIALGSGTSGGTLAPMLTLGAGMGALLTSSAAGLWPGLGLDPHAGALVGMAALFGAAASAPLAAIVFALEATRQSAGMLPLLSCTLVAFSTTRTLQTHSIMTHRLAGRGVKVPHGWGANIHKE